MNILIVLIVPVAIGIIFAAINKEVRKAEKNMDGENFTIRPSRIIMWIGLIDTLMFSALLVLLTMDDTSEWWLYLIAILLILLGLAVLAYAIRWKVEVRDDGFRYCSLFKRPRSFSFDDITRGIIKGEYTISEQITLYSGDKKLFSLESSCRGYHLFVSCLRKKGKSVWSEPAQGIGRPR